MTAYRYFADLSRRADGAPLGQFALALDPLPVIEWARFMALQQWLEPVQAAGARIAVQPQWHSTSGAPYLEGLRATARAPGAPAVTVVIPTGYFSAQVHRLAEDLVAQRKLAPGERFTYVLVAHPAPAPPRARARDALAVEEEPVPLPLPPGSLAEFQARSVACGPLDPALLPVFIHRQVVDELLRLTEQGGELEVGAILIGRLRLDAAARAIFLEVTAQIPARHTLSESAKISFQPATWAAATDAIALRNRGELMVGWFHSHPARFWCRKECPAEARAQCTLNRPFFSTADLDFHRVAAWQPYAVALLATNAFTGLKLTLFGWHQAVIAPRPFSIINPDGAARPIPVADAAPHLGDPHHETTQCPSQSPGS